MTKQFLSLATCVLFAATAAAADKRMRATVRLADGSVEKVWGIKWGFDEFRYSFDEHKDVFADFPSEDVESVEWRNTDRLYSQGKGKFSNQHYDEAIDFFERATEASRYPVARLQSMLKIAEAHAAQGNHAKAAAAYGRLAEEYADWVYAIDARIGRAEQLLAGGKIDEADGVYRQLAEDADGYGKHWGARARARAAIGRAEILRRKDEHVKAAELIEAVLASTSPGGDPELYGRLLAGLAADYRKTDQAEKALATYERTLLLPIPSGHRAEAWLAMARHAADQGQTITAFDRACVAALLGRESPVHGKARSLASKLVDTLVDDPKLSDDEKLEYKSYLEKL